MQERNDETTYHQKKILRLDVSVSDTLLVDVIDRFKKNLASLSSFAFGVNFLINDALQEFTTLHFLHDHIHMLLLFKYILQSNNMRTTTKELERCNLVFKGTESGLL
jgi:hypothetical protein